MKKIVFTTFITSDYKNKKVEFDLFYKSFVKFNPDAELIVNEDLDVKRIFSKSKNTSMINWKCALAKELYNDYERVVVIDSDHFIFNRLDEVLACDYEVAIPTNYNNFLNINLTLHTATSDNGLRHSFELVPYQKYYQGGFVCGTKNFWKAYEYACDNHGNSSPLGENNVLNLLLALYPFDLKILDGADDLKDPNFKYFYNCASLKLEKEFCVVNDMIMCRGKQVKSYHVAHASNKKKFNQLFNQDVQNWFYNKIG